MSLATPPPLDQPIALPSAAPPPYTPSPHPPGPVKSAEMVKAWQKGNASQKAKGKSTVRPRFSFDTIAHARLRAQFWDEVHLDFMWAQASDNEIVRGFLDENLWTEAANKMTALMLERFPDEFTPPPPPCCQGRSALNSRYRMGRLSVPRSSRTRCERGASNAPKWCARYALCSSIAAVF